MREPRLAVRRPLFRLDGSPSDRTSASTHKSAGTALWKHSLIIPRRQRQDQRFACICVSPCPSGASGSVLVYEQASWSFLFRRFAAEQDGVRVALQKLREPLDRFGCCIDLRKRTIKLISQI